MKTKSNLIAFFLLAVTFIFPISKTYSQQIIGFWEVKEVKVGSEIKTPVAKWTRINNDGTFQSGNGWLQNSEGTWEYDKKSETYLAVETNGIKDEFGAFKVSFSGKQMVWHRNEEDMQVVVILEKVSKMPKSTADQLVGLWDLVKMTKDGANETALFDPENKHYVFIRWDRIFVERTPDGKRATGYWHINGHRPEVTMLSHDENKQPQKWTVEVNDAELKMTRISDDKSSVQLTYKRISEFPK